MPLQLEARNADLGTIVRLLQEQRVRRVDLVTSASAFRSVDGNVFIEEGPNTKLLEDDGVTNIAGLYVPTKTADEGLATKLHIPSAYLRDLRGEGRFDIYDANVNLRLHGLVTDGPDGPTVVHPPLDTKYLLRLLKGDEGEPGVARAVLSPKYKIMDNLDVLLAVMDGIRQAGVNALPSQCDLTDSRMFVRFDAPEIAALAPKLLDGYRSPFEGRGGVKRAGDDDGGMVLRSEYGGWDAASALAAARFEGQGYPPGEEPIVWAGLVVSNSDVGQGSRWIYPVIRVRVCRNGLTLVAEASRKVHLGSEQSEGVVQWSTETQEKELALITSQAKDSVLTYLSQEFLDAQVAKIEALADAPVAEPEVTIKEVAKVAGFTETEAKGILDHFLRGGAYTAGGAANAVTSYSQTLDDAGRAHEIDTKAVRVLELAAARA